MLCFAAQRRFLTTWSVGLLLFLVGCAPMNDEEQDGVNSPESPKSVAPVEYGTELEWVRAGASG